MKKVITIIIALILSLPLLPLRETFANQVFEDVPATHDYYDEIMYLLDKNVINEAEKYGLNDIVTREEVAVMVSKAVGLDGTPRETNFSDVLKSNPNSGYIQSAYEKGVLGGYPDGTFKPNQKVTRGQMAVFIANAFDLPDGVQVFKDVKQGQTGYDQIKKLVAAGITSGYADGTFKPANHLTRAHISLFLVKAMKYDGTVTYDTNPVEPQPTPEPVSGVVAKVLSVYEDAGATVEGSGDGYFAGGNGINQSYTNGLLTVFNTGINNNYTVAGQAANKLGGSGSSSEIAAAINKIFKGEASGAITIGNITVSSGGRTVVLKW
nr:S-layer homology domain-containing protein [Lysinibacillus timonensis]